MVFEISTNTQSVPEPDFVLGAVVAIGALIIRLTSNEPPLNPQNPLYAKLLEKI